MDKNSLSHTTWECKYHWLGIDVSGSLPYNN